MELLLMGLCIGLLGLAVSAAAFGAATRPTGAAVPLPTPGPSLAPSKFFLGAEARPPAKATTPSEVLLLQLEQHIRLEQAAAEGFLDTPTAESLHGATASRWAN